MEKLLLWPQDKANHFIYGALAFVVALFFLHYAGLQHRRLYACAAVVLIGAAKEAFDYLSNRRSIAAGGERLHDVDVFDFLATCAGGLTCFLATKV